jgi:7-cyano-7-deazaguanine reductase
MRISFDNYFEQETLMTFSESKLQPEQSELGKHSIYSTTYDPTKLFPIARKANRQNIGIVDESALPFFGFDCWNHYEVSWLNERGKPLVAIAVLVFPCSSPNIIESKSLKLYFNSFNNSKFKDAEAIRTIVQKDLSAAAGTTVAVKILSLQQFQETTLLTGFEGLSLDALDVTCNVYETQANFLTTEDVWVEDEILCSDLLRSNCLVTHQPDWGSVQITYTGKKIHHEGLLKYLVSFRNHNEFHEQCIERIFMDLKRLCQPQKLTVLGRYTRRGGLDINPYRSTEAAIEKHIYNPRFCRQ